MLLLLFACVGLPECDDYCEARADCVGDAIEANGSNWSDWTGFSDRDAYVDACIAPFEESHDLGTPRAQVQGTCRDAQEFACPDGG